MEPLAFILHSIGFAAPALAVGLLVTVAGRLVLPSNPQRLGWWPSFAMNSIAGLVVLGAGLWYFGRDGKMLTYSALVVVVATCQWLSGRGWRA